MLHKFVIVLVASRRSDRPPRDLHLSLLCFGEAGNLVLCGIILLKKSKKRRRKNFSKSKYAYSYMVTCRRIFISSITHTVLRQKLLSFSLHSFREFSKGIIVVPVSSSFSIQSPFTSVVSNKTYRCTRKGKKNHRLNLSFFFILVYDR